MAIRRTTPKPHVVIVDTNALWHKDKAPAVSPDFDKGWDEVAKLARLELVVPETVREELLFQQTSSAWKRLESARDAVREISGIASKSCKIRLTDEVVRQQVGDKIDRWLRTRKAKIAPIPIKDIDWKEVCANAVWRIPPFTSDPKNPELEKGFRDSLILATVMNVVRSETRDVNLVFLCGDNLLRRTVLQRLKDDQRFGAYEDVAAFSSYVRLTKEKLDNAFIQEILGRAAEKFLTSNDPSSLYIRENLGERVRQEFSDFFIDPERSDRSGVTFPSSYLGTWIAVDAGRWWLTHPEFVSLEPKRIYHWKSRLSFGRGYRRQAAWATATPLVKSGPDLWNEHVLYLPFDIYWKASVKADARFYDVELERISLTDNSFKMPTEEERLYFGLAPANG